MSQRAMGWPQNPSRFDTLKYVVGVLCRGSYSNIDILNNRLPLILRNGLISKQDLSVQKAKNNFESGLADVVSSLSVNLYNPQKSTRHKMVVFPSSILLIRTKEKQKRSKRWVFIQHTQIFIPSFFASFVCYLSLTLQRT